MSGHGPFDGEGPAVLWMRCGSPRTLGQRSWIVVYPEEALARWRLASEGGLFSATAASRTRLLDALARELSARVEAALGAAPSSRRIEASAGRVGWAGLAKISGTRGIAEAKGAAGGEAFDSPWIFGVKATFEGADAESGVLAEAAAEAFESFRSLLGPGFKAADGLPLGASMDLGACGEWLKKAARAGSEAALIEGACEASAARPPRL